MEESEKRRERLKAMRTEASRSGIPNDPGTSSAASSHLCNPLIDTMPTPPVQPDSSTASRFDYYTDPMSAFSGSKRSKFSNQNSQDCFTPPPRPTNPYVTPSPSHLARPPYSPDLRMPQFQSPYIAPPPYGSPLGVGVGGPCGPHQGSPRAWNSPVNASGYHVLSNSSRGSNFASPRFGQGGSPTAYSGWGRGRWFSNSPVSGSGYRGSPWSNSGRGKGRSGNFMCPGVGRGGRMGSHSQDSPSAELRPDLYYDKSMVEDPWKLLSPVTWEGRKVSMKSFSAPGLSFTKSTGMKKPGIYETSEGSSSGPSLAEYLAASFNEAVNSSETIND